MAAGPALYRGSGDHTARSVARDGGLGSWGTLGELPGEGDGPPYSVIDVRVPCEVCRAVCRLQT